MEAILPSLLSAHGLLQILMVYDADVLLLNFLLGCYSISVMNSSLLIYLFILFTHLLILNRANKFHKNYVSQGGVLADSKKQIARAGNLSM